VEDMKKMIAMAQNIIAEVELAAREHDKRASLGNSVAEKESEEEVDESSLTSMERTLRAMKRAKAKKAAKLSSDDENQLPYDPKKDNFIVAMTISFP